MESIDNKEKNKSLSDLFGMEFKNDGSWTAKDVGTTPKYRKLNRKERRIQKSIQNKINKKGK